MIQYIKEIAATIQIAKDNHVGRNVEKSLRAKAPSIFSLLQGFSEELDRLDPRDFDPAVRHDFVVYRLKMRSWAKESLGNFEEPAADALKMSDLLNSYQGPGSGAVVRSFSFVTKPDVRKIVERDYRELSQRAFPDASWKSTVILAGSILEAVLYDILTKDATAVKTAMDASNAPKYKSMTKNIELNDYKNEWRLNDFIKVSCELKILPYDDEKAIHHVLREYRNLVHPRAEIAMGVNISESHATTSKGMLDVILDHLNATLGGP